MVQAPIRFYDPEDEIRSQTEIALANYNEAAAIAQSRGDPPPSVEDVFPSLIHAVKQSGQNILHCPIRFHREEDQINSERSRLNQLVKCGFQAAPHMLADLVQPPACWGNPVNSPQQQTQEILPSVPAPNVVFTEMPACSESAWNTVRQKPEDTSQRKPDPAYDLEQLLIHNEKIKVIGEVFYRYAQTHYEYISAENLQRIIMRHNRNAVAFEGNVRLVKAIFQLLTVEPEIAQKGEDVDPFKVSFQNGVLDLKTGALFAHSPHHNTYYCIQGNYRSGSHPVFDSFINTVTQGDSLLQERILQAIGYCLVPDLNGKAFIVLQGVPDSGKSQLGLFIQRCFNQDVVTAIDLLSLGDRFSNAALIGKQLCTEMDLPAGILSSKATSKLKELTGQDIMYADIKYRPAVSFFNRAKIVVGTNHTLCPQDTDSAFYRRAIVIPFRYSVPLEAQDHNLQAKLNQERDAIIFDAIQAYFRLRANSYRFAGNFQLNEMFSPSWQIKETSVSNLLRQFISTCCVVEDGATEFVQSLYEHFLAANPSINLPITEFSSQFLATCNQMNPSAVSRGSKARMTPGANPQARLSGIRLKKDVSFEQEES